MVVRLRIALSGQRHNRIYHIVAAHHRRRRDGKPIETLGIFNPRLKPGETTRTVEWSADRIRYWLGVGARPSEAVSKLLALGGIQTPTSSPAQSKPAATSTSQDAKTLSG
ncbi:ribosomal protein S16 [Cristinia sonorae]|uniref:Ribosomal protein S16 n=1 Tax=Cristinia sonorae TaxID=1940300 RepID=A0A8K0URZ5_9AGAR|nr:ribosomal protein S16 [Cristinia sonorae]